MKNLSILQDKKKDIYDAIDFLVSYGFSREIAFLNFPEAITDGNYNIIGFSFSSTISISCRFTLRFTEKISFFDIDFLEVSKEFKEIRDNYLSAKYPNIKK